MRMTAADRKPVPAAIANAPTVLPGLHLYFQAFMDLTTCRAPGGSIPWTAMHDWARIHGLSTVAEFDRFVALIKAMDVAYLTFQKDRSAAEAKKHEAQARRGRGRGNVSD